MSRSVLVLSLFFSGSALAEKPSVAVLDIQGTGIDQNLLPTLTEILTVEVDSLGMYKVIAGRDVQAMLGFEKQKDVVGCTDAACLAEIGGALGVERIIAGHIGKVGSTYVVNIKLINIRMANTEARVYETVKGEVDALIDTIRKSVVKLLGAGSNAAKAVGAVPTKTVSATTAAPPPARNVAATTPTEPPPTVQSSGGGGPGFVPLALMGAGGLGVGVGVLFGLRARGFEEDANMLAPGSPPAGDPNVVYAEGSQLAAQKASRSALLANVLLIAGVAVAGSGVVVWLLGGSDKAKTAMVPVIGPDSVGFAIAGEL